MKESDYARLEAVANRRIRKINDQGRAFILRCLNLLEKKQAKRQAEATNAA